MKYKMTLKTGIIFFSIVILASGCSSKDAHGLNPEKPVTINVWTYYNSSSKIAFDELVDEFNDTIGNEKGIVVNASSTGGVSELNEKIKLELEKDEKERNMPDLFGCYMDTAWDVEQEDLLVDLSEYFSGDELDTYVTSYLEDGYIDDVLKVLPVAKSTENLAMNRTEWDKFSAATGVEKEQLCTWEGITQTAKIYYEWTDGLTEEPNDGKAFFGRDSMANFIIVGNMQCGNEIFDVKNGKVSINIDESIMKKIWDNYYVPYISGYFGGYGRFRSDDIKMGKIIAMTGSSTSAAFLPDKVTLENGESYPVDIEILPLPGFKGVEKDFAVQQGAGMAISKSDEAHEYAAAEFLKWFTNVDRNISFGIESSYLPVKKEASDFSKMKEAAEMKQLNWSAPVEDNIEVSLNQVESYSLYNSRPFDNSIQARNILENSLTDLATNDRLKVEELLSKGSTVEEAVFSFNTEAYFQNWLNHLKEQLEETQES